MHIHARLPAAVPQRRALRRDVLLLRLRALQLVLAAQCTALFESRWQQGVDVLHLQARAALRDGSGASFDPTKNACPQLRTDVHFMLY